MEMVRREFLGRTGLAAIGLVGLNPLRACEKIAFGPRKHFT